MLIGNAYKEIIERKYQEMKKAGLAEDILDEKLFGGIKLFINQKPSSVMTSLEIDSDMAYVGTNDLK